MLTTQDRQAGRPFECDRVRLLMATHHACMRIHSENTGPLSFTHSKKAIGIPSGRVNCARYAPVQLRQDLQELPVEVAGREVEVSTAWEVMAYAYKRTHVRGN